MYNMLNLERIINKLPERYGWIGSIILAVLVGFITLISEFVSNIPKKLYYVVALVILVSLLIFYMFS